MGSNPTLGMVSGIGFKVRIPLPGARGSPRRNQAPKKRMARYVLLQLKGQSKVVL